MTNQEKLTKDLVIARLQTVMDPELNIDIHSLGLIYDIQVNPPSIKIVMTFTTPGCPLQPVINEMILQSLSDLVEDVDRDVTLELTFDPPWTPDMMEEAARLELGMQD